MQKDEKEMRPEMQQGYCYNTIIQRTKSLGSISASDEKCRSALNLRYLMERKSNVFDLKPNTRKDFLGVH